MNQVSAAIKQTFLNQAEVEDGVIRGGDGVVVQELDREPFHAERTMVFCKGGVVEHSIGESRVTILERIVLSATGGKFHPRHGAASASVSFNILFYVSYP